MLKPLQNRFEQQSNVETPCQLGLAHAIPKLNAQSIIQWLQTKQLGKVHYPNFAEALIKWVIQSKWDDTKHLQEDWRL